MLGNILGVLGIILTIVFGIYSIWAYRKSKRNVSLEFKNKECYSLFSDDVNRLNIELSYNKKPLSSALLLLKAKLINNGHIDIDKNRVYNPLKVICTEEFKWLESRITVQPDGATTNIKINNPREIQIDWDLLKTEEFIEIEALVEIENSEKLEGDKSIEFYNRLVFDFRITDLNTIQKEKEVSKFDRKRSIFNSYAIPIVPMLLGIIILLLEVVPSLKFLPAKHNIIYSIEKGSLKDSIYLSSGSSEVITMRYTDSDIKNTISVKEFNKKYKIENIVGTKLDPKDAMFTTILGIVYLVLGSLLLWIRIRIERRRKRIK